MLPEFYQFRQPTKVIYGEGLTSDFTHELGEFKASKYFMVSDHVINDLGLLTSIKEGMEEGGITVTGLFLDVPQDASIEAVEAISKQATETGAEGLIAIGGGSVIDATKAANFTFSHGGDFIEDYSGAGTLTEYLKPFVVIPTTAGTGSECTIAAVIYDAKNKTKLAFSDRCRTRLLFLNSSSTSSECAASGQPSECNHSCTSSRLPGAYGSTSVPSSASL